MQVTAKVNAAKTLLTLSWAKIEGAQGFTFWKDGIRISYTMDGTRTSTSFSLDGKPHTFEVRCLGILDKFDQDYPIVVTPPLPVSGVVLGVNCYPIADSGQQGLALDLKAQSLFQYIRVDRDRPAAIQWAHANGLKVCEIIWCGSPSAGTDIIEWDNEPYYNGWGGKSIPAYYQAARDAGKSLKQSVSGKPFIVPFMSVTNGGDVYALPKSELGNEKAVQSLIKWHEAHAHAMSRGLVFEDANIAADQHMKRADLDHPAVYGATWQPNISVANSASPDIWDNIDGLAIHPYTSNNGPAAAFAAMDKLRGQLQAIGGRAATLPFYITEVGWTQSGTIAVSSGAAASFVTQLIQGCKARKDVALCTYYSLKDNGTSTSDQEAQFGLYNTFGVAKPAAAAFKTA